MAGRPLESIIPGRVAPVARRGRATSIRDMPPPDGSSPIRPSCLAQTPTRIAVGPQLALRDVLQASDLHGHAKNLSIDRSGQERLISIVGRELDAELTYRRRGVERMGNHDIGVQRIDRLHKAVDGQPADETIRPERLARRDQRAKSVAPPSVVNS